MSCDGIMDGMLATRRRSERAYEGLEASHVYVLQLIAVLLTRSGGLRRWSVMRAMRTRCEKLGREVSPKFEDEVERAFRKHCTDFATRHDSRDAAPSEPAAMLFHRPKETAGEVWAVDPVAAKSWLEAEDLTAAYAELRDIR